MDAVALDTDFIEGTKRWARVVKVPAVFVTYYRISKSFLRSSQKMITVSHWPQLCHILNSCREVWTNKVSFPIFSEMEEAREMGVENVSWVSCK